MQEALPAGPRRRLGEFVGWPVVLSHQRAAGSPFVEQGRLVAAVALNQANHVLHEAAELNGSVTEQVDVQGAQPAVGRISMESLVPEEPGVVGRQLDRRRHDL